MSVEKIREEFQKHRTSVAAHLIQGEDWEGAYRRADALVSLASFTAGWRASREALVIDLPEVDTWSHCSEGMTVYRGQCQQNIEAVGVKVKS